MVYEYALFSSDVEDAPFCLCRGFPRILVPCSCQSIDKAGVGNDLLTVERVDEFKKVDPLKFLPFVVEVSSTWIGGGGGGGGGGGLYIAQTKQDYAAKLFACLKIIVLIDLDTIVTFGI